MPLHDLYETLAVVRQKRGELRGDPCSDRRLGGGEVAVPDDVVPGGVEIEVVALDDALDELRPSRQDVPVSLADEHALDIEVGRSQCIDVEDHAVSDREDSLDPA